MRGENGQRFWDNREVGEENSPVIMRNMRELVDQFRKVGFLHLKSFFHRKQLIEIHALVAEAHENWVRLNDQALKKGSVNSAYLTSPLYCRPDFKRDCIFHFIQMTPIVHLASALMNGQPYFMNTQLFFNPVIKEKEPYWHRDIQYSGLPKERQMDVILKDHVLHFRIPFSEDPGLEFIPGSHLRWDTEEEEKVRLELAGRRNCDALPGSIKVPHSPTDLLVFSAHLIHKGVYGGDRFSFDVLFASFMQAIESVREYNHFPSSETIEKMENGGIFELK